MHWLRSTIWFGIIAVAGIVVGFASAALQRAGMSPLLIFSLLLGAALAVAAVGAARVFAVGTRPLLIVGTILGSLILVSSQHLALYRAYVEGWELKRSEQQELTLFRDPPPHDFLTYLEQEAADGRPWLWLLDAALVTAAAVGLTLWWRSRTGYCDACGNWLQLRWRGPADAVDAPPAVKDACASASSTALHTQATVLVCPQGCGTAVVKLTWEEGGTTNNKTINASA